ncbi:hypothetical protein IFM51744_03964 [Aspergillus udagawae]|uniref:Uncharacterized protein n=1 Tax=Aspergillus udagawae TaxID=91492 RepID=A0A8H3RUV6_9EURO|nr:uncharacterized protein Aud_009165 [Aspergillus udagawae]GFF38642.1 hypothetical protein IFM46972_05615 [Aspergillus udagawae]GFF38946.1 hypothetical protein IFM51744_03964 [Aspergillus udagawae]GFG04870.1 hypothetical protein IFM5058_02141 [Aspergillus udagawae]GIC92694.1 hypothetical protein Aud_009165 [Aspergillus udagawae]
MVSSADSMYMASYPSRWNQPSQHPMNVDMAMELGSNNPYHRYISPSPTLSPSSSTSTLNTLSLERSPSVPSIYWSGELEHQPVEPRRRRNTYHPTYAQQSTQGSRHRTRYRRGSLLVTPDVIDRLDNAGVFHYHHESPYDAVYAERNHDAKTSPIAALEGSTNEALKATPEDKLADCLNSHRPLDGVAFYPPGTTDREGRTYEYEEGTNMMNDYGNFVRFPGLKFTEEDFKKDPFYNSPLPKPFEIIRKAFSRHCRSWKRNKTT